MTVISEHFYQFHCITLHNSIRFKFEMKKKFTRKKTEILGNERNKGDNKKKSVERLIAWKCRREVGPMKLYTTNAANSTIKNRAHLKNELKYNNDGKMKGKNRILHESFFCPLSSLNKNTEISFWQTIKIEWCVIFVFWKKHRKFYEKCNSISGQQNVLF